MKQGNWYSLGNDQYRFYKKRPDGLLIFDGYKGKSVTKGKFLIGWPAMERELKTV